MSTTLTYVYTGQPVDLVIPPGVTTATADLWGGAGSSGTALAVALGARVRVTMQVAPGERLRLRVAGSGDQGGYNGGGRAGSTSLYGGGASDIRRAGDGPEHRIVVAGGAGSSSSGAGAANNGARLGGAGGTPNGGTGANGSPAPPFLGATGGTQTAGGGPGIQSASLTGTLGQGANASAAASTGGAGGGGFYGGGAAISDVDGADVGGGGGGSSFSAFGGAVFSSALTESGSITITYDRPPSQPDRLNPPAGTAFDRNVRNRLSWRHNDADGEGQDGYDIALLRPGASVWDAPNMQQSANSFHDLVVGLPGGAYLWRVQTRNVGGTSPWSEAGSFTLGDRPPGPTWLDPIMGQAIPTRTYELRWSGTGVTYRIRSVRDNAGQRDETVEYARVGYPTPLPVGQRRQQWTFPSNGRAEWLLIEEADSNGLWSSVAAARVTVSYTLPARALYRLSGDAARLALRVQIVTPTPAQGQPATARHVVRVRERGDTGQGQLVSDAVARNGTALYRFPAFGVEHEVLVGSVGENGAVDDGAWTALSTVQDVPTPEGAGRFDTARYDIATYGQEPA